MHVSKIIESIRLAASDFTYWHLTDPVIKEAADTAARKLKQELVEKTGAEVDSEAFADGMRLALCGQYWRALYELQRHGFDAEFARNQIADVRLELMLN